MWSQSSITTLQNCFDITDWRVFRDLWTDLDEFTTTVSAYIRFCCNVCLPTKTVTSYPNNKQWCNKPIRNKIVAKDRAYRFRSTDPEKYRAAKKDLDMAIYNSKTIYKHKLEDIFNSGDSKKLWSNMNLITQYKGTKKSADSDDVELPDKLNEFYARFDRDNTTTPTPLPVDEEEPCPLTITDHDVRREFGRLKEHKAAGPDQIRPKLLKFCKSELAPVFSLIFNWSIQLCKVPKIF